MTDIDRRTLIGLAGAGLVLAGCTPETRDNVIVDDGEDCEGEGEEFGECSLWGHTVNRPTPLNVPPGTVFSADYLCAAYIRFEAGAMIIRQGHVQLTGNAKTNENDQNVIAQKLLRVLKFPTETTDIVVQFRHDNFDNFSLNGKQVLVLCVDNLPQVARFVTAADMPSSENVLEHIVRFTKYSGTDYKVVKKNHNFCAIKRIDPPTSDFEGPDAYRLNFWNRTPSGSQINAQSSNSTTHFRYSMNIHLKMAVNPTVAGSRMLPIILDPDTGNMGSNP